MTQSADHGHTPNHSDNQQASEHAEPTEPIESTEDKEPTGPSEHDESPERAEPSADPTEPTEPTERLEPSEYAEYSEHAEFSAEPTEPTEPTESAEPTGPAEHAEPTEPTIPAAPAVPAQAQRKLERTPEPEPIPQQEEHVPDQASSTFRDASELPGDSKHTFAQAFAIEKPKVNDLWAGLLMVVTFCGFAVVSGITIRKYVMNLSIFGVGVYDTVNSLALNLNTAVLIGFILCVSFLVSWAYFVSARAFTTQFIWVTGILNIVFAVGTAIYYMVRRQWIGGTTFLFFGIFAIVCFTSWIPRIPFSVMVLQTTMDVARDQGHIFMLSGLGALAATAFASWFSVTLVAVYVAFGPGGGSSPLCINGACSTVMLVSLIGFVTFAGYLITEWMKNIIHTTIAGIYGSWYYFSSAGIPKRAARGGFRRAVTYSFGSVSFGSLAIAIINTFRQIFSVVRYRESGAGVCGLAGSIVRCLAGCVLTVLDWLTTFFNRYAFVHVALYGKAFIPAAKDTWAIMKDRGIDALVNDSLVNAVLSMGSIFVAYLCSLLSYLFLQFTSPAYNQGGTFTPVIMMFAFIISLQVCQIFLAPIGSGADTIFVVMAKDPQIAIRDHPELWGKIVDVYPKVQRAVQT